MQSAPFLYLHLGLAKTGTTFLQSEVLPRMENVKCFVKPMTDLVKGPNPWSGALRSFFWQSPAIWNELGPSLWEEIFGPSPDGPQPRPVLVSDENVAVNLSKKRNYIGPEGALSSHVPYRLPAHLGKVAELAEDWGFGGINILLSVRRQGPFLASDYAQTSDQRPAASQEDFEECVREIISKDEKYYRDGVCLDFNLLRRLIVQVVGENGLLMLPYELMKEDLPAFITAWLTFMNVPPGEARKRARGLASRSGQRKNVRSRSRDTWAVRDRTTWDVKTFGLRPKWLFSRIDALPTYVPMRLPEFGRGDEIALTPSLDREIMSTYMESNRALAEAIPEYDWGRYGYF